MKCSSTPLHGKLAHVGKTETCQADNPKLLQVKGDTLKMQLHCQISAFTSLV